MTVSNEQEQDLLEWAWVIIANAGGGDWTRETPKWQEAAARWRDQYHGLKQPPDDATPGRAMTAPAKERLQ